MILDRFRLTDKVAVVTGAGRGIGEGVALAFAEAGAHLVLAARTRVQIEAVAGRIERLGRRALAVPCDVSERAALEALVERALEAFGRIDVLVNNAGGAPPRPALETSERAFEEALRMNVTSAFLLTRLVARHMLSSGSSRGPSDRAGSVLNVSSAMGRLSERGFVAYGTAKAALSHMTRLLAADFAPRVRVNALAVGAVETPALAPFLESAEVRRAIESRTPLRRLGTPDDIALAALYLASPAADYVTGKVLEIDGGAEAAVLPLGLPDL